jgi:hypothetical protein
MRSIMQFFKKFLRWIVRLPNNFAFAYRGQSANAAARAFFVAGGRHSAVHASPAAKWRLRWRPPPSIDNGNELIAGATAIAHKDRVAEFAILPVPLSGCKAHWYSAIRTDWRTHWRQKRIAAVGFCHGRPFRHRGPDTQHRVPNRSITTLDHFYDGSKMVGTEEEVLQRSARDGKAGTSDACRLGAAPYWNCQVMLVATGHISLNSRRLVDPGFVCRELPGRICSKTLDVRIANNVSAVSTVKSRLRRSPR